MGPAFGLWWVRCNRLLDMMKRGGTLLAVAALLVLTGCSAPEAKPPVEAGEVTTVSASPSAAPKVMSLKSNAEESAASGERPEADESFYFKTFDLWKSEGRELPSDAELLALGYGVCEQLDSGVNSLKTVVVKGTSEDAVGLSQYVRGSAVSALCPEHL